MSCYWWWLNGVATEASITRDLEEMSQRLRGGLVDRRRGIQPGDRKARAGQRVPLARLDGALPPCGARGRPSMGSPSPST